MPEFLSPSPAVLPRRMAIRLFEVAQGAGGIPLRLLITCEAFANEPDCIELIEAGTAWEQVIDDLSQRDRKLWAIFQYAPMKSIPPIANDCDADLHLVASLDVPGVLQIHAWRRTGDMVTEVPVQIAS